MRWGIPKDKMLKFGDENIGSGRVNLEGFRRVKKGFVGSTWKNEFEELCLRLR